MDNIRKDKSEKDVSVVAEEILKSYADSWAEAYADEAEELLRDDEQYQKAVAKYENHKRKDVKKRMLRCAAVLLCAIFIASIAVPIPQAHAWRVWWLNLVMHENVQDIDVRPNDDYAGEYYVSELPEGFVLESERRDKGQYVVTYLNDGGQSIIFMQTLNMTTGNHIDNEKTEYEVHIVGDFEVLVGENDERIIFEMMTERTFLMISTDAGYDTGVQFIENLHEI